MSGWEAQCCWQGWGCCAPRPSTHSAPLALSHGPFMSPGCPELSAWAHIWCPHVAHHWWRLPWVPSCAPLAPEHHHHYSTDHAQEGSLSTQGTCVTPVLHFGTSVTPSASKLPGVTSIIKSPQDSGTQVLLSPYPVLVLLWFRVCKSHWQLSLPGRC